MRISGKGRVTIPMDILEKSGLLPLTEVAFIVEPDSVRIVKARHPKGPSRGDIIVARMQRARGHTTMTTDELMALTRSEV
jgi:bifunctional DNA-binding transcriptional regulator/antitoxin component of YhaV-PrlF toxin-antitoxin module